MKIKQNYSEWKEMADKSEKYDQNTIHVKVTQLTYTDYYQHRASLIPGLANMDRLRFEVSIGDPSNTEFGKLVSTMSDIKVSNEMVLSKIDESIKEFTIRYEDADERYHRVAHAIAAGNYSIMRIPKFIRFLLNIQPLVEIAFNDRPTK